MTGRVLFFGGNGHCAARLERARVVAARAGITIDEVPYPGFEDRPRATDLETFLDALAASARDATFVYATGIGGLIALCLRARGALRGRRLLLQAPVLWGLEHRRFPWLMRFAPVRRVATALFATRGFRAAFVRRYFRRGLSPDERAAFFDGYARCAALPDLFAWITPVVLRELERAFAADRSALEDVAVWWGGQDAVVTLDELRFTEQALGVRWPVRRFSEWGHYPMIDTPEEWTAALAEALTPGRQL